MSNLFENGFMGMMPINSEEALDSRELALPTQLIKENSSHCFWAVGDYKQIKCEDGLEDDYYVFLESDDGKHNFIEDGSLSSMLNSIDERFLSKEAVQDFRDILWSKDIVIIEDRLNRLFKNKIRVFPVRRTHVFYIESLSVSEDQAREYLFRNSHLYSKEAHIYPITTWGNIEVEKKLLALESFNWSVSNSGENKN